MKTNKILLISLAVFLLGFMIFFILSLKRSLDIIHENEARQHKFKTVAINNFDKLVFSSNCDVLIQQGKRCIIDIEEKGDSLLKPSIRNIDGSLNFIVDSALAKNTDKKIRVRISMPFLYAITAGNGTAIQLDNFTSDSVLISLRNGCKFVSNKNALKRVWYKTNGSVEMKLVSPL